MLVIRYRRPLQSLKLVAMLRANDEVHGDARMGQKTADDRRISVQIRQPHQRRENRIVTLSLISHRISDFLRALRPQPVESVVPVAPPRYLFRLNRQ